MHRASQASSHSLASLCSTLWFSSKKLDCVKQNAKPRRSENGAQKSGWMQSGYVHLVKLLPIKIISFQCEELLADSCWTTLVAERKVAA